MRRWYAKILQARGRVLLFGAHGKSNHSLYYLCRLLATNFHYSTTIVSAEGS